MSTQNVGLSEPPTLWIESKAVAVESGSTIVNFHWPTVLAPVGYFICSFTPDETTQDGPPAQRSRSERFGGTLPHKTARGQSNPRAAHRKGRLWFGRTAHLIADESQRRGRLVVTPPTH